MIGDIIAVFFAIIIIASIMHWIYWWREKKSLKRDVEYYKGEWLDTNHQYSELQIKCFNLKCDIIKLKLKHKSKHKDKHK